MQFVCVAEVWTKWALNEVKAQLACTVVAVEVLWYALLGNTNTENVVPTITYPIASNPQFVILSIWPTTLSTVIGRFLVTFVIRFLRFLVFTSLGLLFFLLTFSFSLFSPFPPFSPSFAVLLLSCPVLVASFPFETLPRLYIFH